MRLMVNRDISISMLLTRIAVALLLFVVSACAGASSTPVSDPPGALVRLQRNAAATTLPGYRTISSLSPSARTTYFL